MIYSSFNEKTAILRTMTKVEPGVQVMVDDKTWNKLIDLIEATSVLVRERYLYVTEEAHTNACLALKALEQE